MKAMVVFWFWFFFFFSLVITDSSIGNMVRPSVCPHSLTCPSLETDGLVACRPVLR